MERETEILKIIPDYNFIYELAMPSGKKVANTLKVLIMLIILYVLISIVISNFNVSSLEAFNKLNIDITKVVGILFLILTGISLIKMLFHIVFQLVQYKNMSYTFYNDHMVYEDKFLNQYTKNIKYSNIREVEVIKNVWDRINGYGIIVIYTSAEKNGGNGLVMYGIKRPDEYYEKIYDIIHMNTENNQNSKLTEVDEVENFKDSLK